MRMTWPETMNKGTEEAREKVMLWITLWQWRTWNSGHDPMVKFAEMMKESGMNGTR